MSINPLYHKWFRELRQLWPDERLSRVHLWAWFLAGIYTSRSVQLHRVALKIPSSAQLTSVTRRLRRFLDNPRVRVPPCYEPMARSLLEESAQSLGEIRLLLDTTAVGANHRLLMVALAYRRRRSPSRGPGSARRKVSVPPRGTWPCFRMPGRSFPVIRRCWSWETPSLEPSRC